MLPGTGTLVGTQLRRAIYFCLCLALVGAGPAMAAAFSLHPDLGMSAFYLASGGFMVLGLGLYGLWYDFLRPWLNATLDTDFEDDFGRR